MTISEQFRVAIISMIENNVPIQNEWVTVTAVDWDAKTMDAVDNDGVEHTDVFLGLGGNHIKPVISKKALIGIIENETAASFLILAEETEEFNLKGDQFGGLIIIEKLVEKINGLEQLLNQLITDYSTHQHTAPQAPSGALPTTPLLKPFIGQQITPITKIKDLENDTVKHG